MPNGAMLRRCWPFRSRSNEDSPEVIELDEEQRAALERVLEHVRPVFDRAADQIFSTAKWLMASLLAVNGAGLLSFLSNGSTPQIVLQASAPLWLAGVTLALCTGLAAYWSGVSALRTMGLYIGRAEAAKVTGYLEEWNWDRDSVKIDRRGRIPFLFGIASMLCFIAGALVAMKALQTANATTPPPAAVSPTKAQLAGNAGFTKTDGITSK